ncbi:hypothetical protein D6764_01775 [Candidatus Woesearchaeota archaeon]|nr:MAG: hypothetical protein D6764_01775 [Candidatus Woesearchaeota archaeon]
MKRNAVVLSIVILFLLSLSSVHAVEIVPQNACSCGLTTESVRVVNQDSEKHSFTVSVEGEISPFSVVYPPSFTLPGDGYIDVTVDVHFPCMKDKPYTGFIVVESDDGSVNKFPRAYFTRECPNIQLRSASALKEASPCEPVTFRFDITNAAPFKDYFSFKVLPEDYSDFVSLNSQKVALQPRQTHTLFVTTSFPCDVSGKKDFTLITETEKSNLRATTPFSLDIKPDYKFDLSVEDKSLSVCEQTRKKLSVSVANQNDFSQNFHLFLEDSPSWVSLSASSLSVNSSETGVSELTIQPPDGAAGSYEFSVKAVSEYGNISESVPVRVSVSNCYDFTLNFDFPERVCCDAAELPLVLYNNGTESGRFNVSVVSPEGLSLSSDAVFVASGEAKSFALDLDSCPSSADEVVISVAPLDAPELSKTFSRKASFIKEDSCSEIALLKDDFTISYSNYSLKLPVRNIGAKPTYYYFSLVSGSWEHLETFDFVLKPGEEASVKLYLEPEGIPEDKYALELVATTASGQEFRLPFFITLEKEFDLYEFLGSVYMSAVQNPCSFSYKVLLFVFVVSLVLSVAFSLFRSRCKRIKPRRRLTKLLRFFAYLSFVAVLAVGITFLFCNYGLSSITTYVPSNISAPPASPGQSMPSEVNQTANVTVNESEGAQEEFQGFVLEIPPEGTFEWDLSEVFRDPDADVLYYTVISPPSLEVEVNNEKGVALITPLEGFKEGSLLSVIVSDGEYTVSSPPIKVVFSSPEDKETVSANSRKNEEGASSLGKYIFIALLLVLLILFFRVLLSRREQKHEEPALVKKPSVSQLRGPEPPKRKRGRPKGSKNKKKRGRPKKNE